MSPTSSGRRSRVLAVVLLLVAVVLVVVGLQRRPATIDTGANGFVTPDEHGIDARNSPAVAVDPDDPAVMVAADRVDTPNIGCSVSRSEDGGSTWAIVPLPLPPGSDHCFAPDVAFAPDGDLLVLYNVTGGRFNLPVAVWLQRFRGAMPDGGPMAMAGDGAFYPRLAADERRVVATWVQSGPAEARGAGLGPRPNPVVIVRSDDSGRTFTAPVALSEPTRLAIQPTPVLGAGGRVFVGALDLGDDILSYESLHEGQAGPPSEGSWRVVGWTSADGGQTFGEGSVVAEFPVPQRVYVDLGPTPAFVRDPASGRIYVAWDQGREDRTVMLAGSDDGGRTWSGPVAVLTRPGTQILPAVGVSPDGRVDVVFYDRSRDALDQMTEVTISTSWDGGRTFTSEKLSDRPFDARIGLGSAQGLPQLGSQLAVVSEPDRVLAFWADTRRGTQDTNRQDVAVAFADVHDERGARRPLVVEGAFLLVVAVMVLLGVRRSR